MTRVEYRSFIDDNARWDHLTLRDDDIIVCTPAKCGTTWMQLCCALLIFQEPLPPRPMAELSPWLDMLTWPIDEVIALLDAQEHRRFIKTHTPFDGLPWDERVTYVYVGRDPRDAMLSMENHMANMNLPAALAARERAVGNEDLDPAMFDKPAVEDPVERFWQWVDGDGGHEARSPGLAGILGHMQKAWDRRDEPNVALFHYSDLSRDLRGQLRRLATVLGVDITDDRLDSLATAATFSSMKSNADVLAPDTTHGLWQSNERFFDQGRSGRWRDLISEDDLPRYDARVAAIVDPELAHWVHHGWLG